MRITHKLIIGLFLFCLVLSCQQKKSSEETTEVSTNLELDSLGINNNLPPPSEIAAHLEATGAEFNGDALLDLSNVSRYIVDNRKGKNGVLLGAYFANMEYLLAYDKIDSARQYFIECKNLASSIGIEHLFLKTFEIRFKELVESDTVLQNRLNDMLKVTQDTLKQEDLKFVQTAMNVGYTLEGIHELIAIVQNYPKDELPEESLKLILAPIFRAVGNQEERIDKIIGYLEEFNFTANNLFYDDFVRLKKSYEILDFKTKIESGDVNVLIDDPEYRELVKNIDNLREQYTQ